MPVKAVFLLCLSGWLDLCLLKRLFLRLFCIRLFLLGLLGMSSVWVLYMGSCIHPRGAVGSRPMPWTRLRCSELHRCFRWCSLQDWLGRPRAAQDCQHGSSIGRGVVVILQTAYSVGEWHYGCGLATICFCAYCKALQGFQGR